jgi:hypothetical protein
VNTFFTTSRAARCARRRPHGLRALASARVLARRLAQEASAHAELLEAFAVACSPEATAATSKLRHLPSSAAGGLASRCGSRPARARLARYSIKDDGIPTTEPATRDDHRAAVAHGVGYATTARRARGRSAPRDHRRIEARKSSFSNFSHDPQGHHAPHSVSTRRPSRPQPLSQKEHAAVLEGRPWMFASGATTESATNRCWSFGRGGNEAPLAMPPHDSTHRPPVLCEPPPRKVRMTTSSPLRIQMPSPPARIDAGADSPGFPASSDTPSLWSSRREDFAMPDNQEPQEVPLDMSTALCRSTPRWR